MSWSIQSAKFGFLELLAAVICSEWRRLFVSHHEVVTTRVSRVS